MPTVLRIGPYRFFFFAGDRDEPAHIHIEREDKVAKFWLDPVRRARNKGIAPRMLRKIEKLVFKHKPFLMEKYHEQQKM